MPEPRRTRVTLVQCHHSGYCGQQTFRRAEGGGEPGSCSPASPALPGCFSKDQVYLDGILRILRHRQTIDFPLLAALGKVTAGAGALMPERRPIPKLTWAPLVPGLPKNKPLAGSPSALGLSLHVWVSVEQGKGYAG